MIHHLLGLNRKWVAGDLGFDFWVVGISRIVRVSCSSCVTPAGPMQTSQTPSGTSNTPHFPLSSRIVPQISINYSGSSDVWFAGRHPHAFGYSHPCSTPQETAHSHFMSCVEKWGKGRKGKFLATWRPYWSLTTHGWLSVFIQNKILIPLKLAETLQES